MVRKIIPSLLAIGTMGFGVWVAAQQPQLGSPSPDAWDTNPQASERQAGVQGALDELPSGPFDRFSASPFGPVQGAMENADGAFPAQALTSAQTPAAGDQPESGQPATGQPALGQPALDQPAPGQGTRRELGELNSRSTPYGRTSDNGERGYDSRSSTPVRSKTIDARSVALRMLEDAADFADQGDVYRARHLAQQAARFPVKWEEGEFSPAELLRRLDAMPQEPEPGLVTTLGSARSKIIYPAPTKEQVEAVHRLPTTQEAMVDGGEPANGDLAAEAAGPSDMGISGSQPSANLPPSLGGSSKIIEYSLPIPFRKPNWDSPPNQEPALNEQGQGLIPQVAPAAGNLVQGNAPTDLRRDLETPGPGELSPAPLPLRQPTEWSNRPTHRVATSPQGSLLRRGTLTHLSPSPEAYRQSQYTSDSGTKVIDSRLALETRQLELERLEIERLDLEQRRDELFRAAAEAQRQVEVTSYQQPRLPLAATPPQLLRIETSSDKTVGLDQTFWINNAPLLSFMLGLVLCPLTLALCFAVVVKQITRHEGPLLQVEFSGNGRPGGSRKRRHRDDDDDDDEDDLDDRPRRAPARKQRPKRRGPARRTAFVDPSSEDAAHRMPPLPGMGFGQNEHELEDQQNREREQAILKHVFEQNLDLREQLRTLDDQTGTE